MSTTALDKIAEYSKSGSNRQNMGDVCFWRLDAARVERQLLLQIWQQAGMDAGLLPEEPTPEKALKAAVQENTTGLKDMLIDKSFEDSKQLIFTIVKKHRHGLGDVTTTQEAKLSLDRKSGSVSLDTPGHTIGEKIRTTFHTLLTTHTTDDVRKAITNAIHSMAAITIRDGGGVYWIPQPYAANIRALKQAVQQIGNSKLRLLPISAVVESEEELVDLAQGSLENELNSLKEQIEKYVTEPPARLSTLSNRLDAFKELRSKAQLYKMVLSTEVSGLEANLQKLEETVQQMIEQKMAGK